MLFSCSQSNQGILGSFETFCEMVASDVKPIAFSQPLEDKEFLKIEKELRNIAEKYMVKIEVEKDLPNSYLFSSDIANNLIVVLIYKENTFKQYQLIKEKLQNFETLSEEDKLKWSRSLGRLLGYSNIGINNLLAKNSPFRTIQHFNIESQTTHFYYKNLEDAVEFYDNILGLKLIEESDNQVLFQISNTSYLSLNKLNEKHPIDQPKSVALALLTDQLTEWNDHLIANNVEIKYSLKMKEKSAHDGLVAVDPEGYLLEFEEFNMHRENEKFIPLLNEATRIETKNKPLNFYGSITWTYHKDLLKMQYFYEDQVGSELVADQGWTKIYSLTPDSFIGIVDERRGMNNYADEKAVEIEWKLSNSKDGFDYLKENSGLQGKDGNQFLTGPEKYLYRIR
jgi:catechol 2,3-dioxygenase-like lactoylglutathione lyase family enzyme